MSHEIAAPATISSESTVDIIAAVIAASRIAPRTGGSTALAIIGMAMSPLGRTGNNTMLPSATTKISRFMPLAATIASRMPRRIVRRSFIAYSRISFSGVATEPSVNANPIVNRSVPGMASQLNTIGFTASA